jgi:hypothetical protein
MNSLTDSQIGYLGTGTNFSSAFYKGESQEKKLSRDWEEQRFLPSSPAHVM